MDCLMMCACGHVGKVQGLGVDRHNRDIYRFSLAVNFDHPESVLWLQCTVVKQPIVSLLTERGLLTGDHLMIVCERASINAVMNGEQARGWLNVEVTQLTLLTAPAIPQLERAAGFEPREMPTILNYAELMKTKAG